MNKYIMEDRNLLEIYKYTYQGKQYVYLVNELDNSDIYIMELQGNNLIEIQDKNLLKDVIYNMVGSVELFY